MRLFFKTLCVPILLLPALAGTGQASELFAVDSSHSAVGFSVRHLVVSKVRGSFGEFSGTISYDSEDPTRSSVQVTIKAASIDTNNDDRDAHLRSEDFFDVEKYPEITFASHKVEQKGDGLVAHGKLTMHGVTRDVSIPFVVNGPIKDPWGRIRLGVEAEPITLDRKDFGLTWNKVLETGGVAVSEEVEVVIELEAVRKAGD